MGREGRAAERLPHFGQFAPVPQRRPFGADVPASRSDDDLRLSWKVSARRWREGSGLRGASCPERAEPGPGDCRAPPAAPRPRSLRPRRVLRHPARLSPPPWRRTTLPRTARHGRFSSGTAPPLPELEPRGSRAPSLVPGAGSLSVCPPFLRSNRLPLPPTPAPRVAPALEAALVLVETAAGPGFPARGSKPHAPPSRAPQLQGYGPPSRTALPPRAARSWSRAAAPIGGSGVPVPSCSLGSEGTSGGAGICRCGG